MKNRKINLTVYFNLTVCFIITTFLFFITVDFVYSQNEQNRYDAVRRRSLISDFKAMGVGEAIKVLIVEETEAGNSAGTNEIRNSTLSGGVGFGINNKSIYGANLANSVDATIGTANNFKGNGANTRKESIRSQLTARVTGEDGRGNYTIEGKRKTKVDGEEQTITLKGIIRGVDIRSDNSIFSYNIMDLELYVEGEGNASKLQQPGLFTKFFRLLF